MVGSLVDVIVIEKSSFTVVSRYFGNVVFEDNEESLATFFSNYYYY